uniref:C-type lectin domain-containing protein n=1 Tax=Gopherus agassizii TaxID=38772 RepID=A0A452H8V9_9SAUR
TTLLSEMEKEFRSPEFWATPKSTSLNNQKAAFCISQFPVVKQGCPEFCLTASICNALPEPIKCAAGWKKFEKACYFFSNMTKDWMGAKQFCTDQNSYLVIVNNDYEQVSYPLCLLVCVFLC